MIFYQFKLYKSILYKFYAIGYQYILFELVKGHLIWEIVFYYSLFFIFCKLIQCNWGEGEGGGVYSGLCNSYLLIHIILGVSLIIHLSFLLELSSVSYTRTALQQSGPTGKHLTCFLLPVVFVKAVCWHPHFSTYILTLPFTWPWMSTDRRREASR